MPANIKLVSLLICSKIQKGGKDRTDVLINREVGDTARSPCFRIHEDL